MRKPLVAIKESGERAAFIVQDMLTLARRGVSTSEITNINDIILKYLASNEHLKLREFNPELKTLQQLAPDLLNIVGSPVHLSKTIMNLVSNAAEAMPHGGSVTLITENRYLDSPLKRYDKIEEGDYVVCIVKDTGTGIPEEDPARIFEPFHSKKVLGRSGTGSGMAVVWGTIKDHNGYIDVASRQGEGSTFTLYFPATREEVKKSQPVSIEEYCASGEVPAAISRSPTRWKKSASRSEMS